MYPLVVQQLDPENNRLLVETNMNQPGPTPMAARVELLIYWRGRAVCNIL